MRNWEYNETKTALVVDEIAKQRLKITGTRFATILGFNDWQSPFTAWCEITKLAKVPFEGSIYTEAGQILEPKVIEYFKSQTGFKNLKTPEEYYGNRYKDVKYDFFYDTKIFGGMWDGLVTKADGVTPRAVVEVKTTKRAEDWANGAPLYYLAQVCLYAYLLEVEDIFLSATFLKDNDYNDPCKFVVTESNTKIFTYKLSEVRFPLNGQNYSFKELVDYAIDWYKYYVEGFESPEFNEKQDKDILAILRTAKPANDSSLDEIISKLSKLENNPEYLSAKETLAEFEKAIKALKTPLKEELVAQLPLNAKKVEYGGWKVAKGESSIIADIEALQRDGMDEYLTVKEGTLTLTKVKG